MLKRPLSGWFRPQPYLKLLIALLLTTPIALTSNQLTLAQSINVIASAATPTLTVEEQALTPLPSEDPLNSPHPIPWEWVMDTQANVSTNRDGGVRYYRTSSVVSPDGDYAAYSRIQMFAQPELYRSRVNSMMFIENLRTGKLRQLKSSFPHPENPSVEGDPVPGTISILTPVGWSRKSDRLLARRFEGVFNSSDATDVAVIWDRQHDRSASVAPSQHQVAQIAQIAAQQTGLNPNLIQQMLPMLVPVVLNLLQGGSRVQNPQGGANPVLNAFLDADRDGDVDIADRYLGQSRYK